MFDIFRYLAYLCFTAEERSAPKCACALLQSGMRFESSLFDLPSLEGSATLQATGLLATEWIQVPAQAALATIVRGVHPARSTISKDRYTHGGFSENLSQTSSAPPFQT